MSGDEVGEETGFGVGVTVVPATASENGWLAMPDTRITEAILRSSARLDGLLEDGIEFRRGPIRSGRECFAT